MRKGSLLIFVFVLAVGLSAFAQHGRGGMGNAGMGNAGSMGRGAGAGAGRESGGPRMGNSGSQMSGMTSQQPLKSSQINGGAFRMLERKYPSLTSAQLQDLYKSSGAKNYGQFVSAMVVSKNLRLDYNKVLSGLQTQSLGKTLQSLGVSKDKAKQAISQAHQEIQDSNSSSTASSGS